MIEAINLSKTYKKNEALKNVSFKIEDNSIVGIVGPNGSGKSTLIKIITNLINDFNGEVKLENLNYTDMSLASEEFGFPSYYSVNKTLNLFAKQKKASASSVEDVVRTLQLTSHLSKNTKELSHGLKQRLNIACALLGNPKVIILDEPTNGLDPDGFILLRKLISSLKTDGKTVIIASHLLNELEHSCDEFLLLKKGEKIIKDRKENLIKKFGSIENAYISLD